MNRKTRMIGSLFMGIGLVASAQNPICPPGLYIADPTARVWDGGMLYVYGSRDDDNLKSYCSHDHWVMRTADMVNWEFFPEVFASKGENDAVPYNNSPLYAPDIMYKDGTYYLYFCQPQKPREGVAVSTSPTGPFTKAKAINIPQHLDQIDPTVFIDDDGQAYYAWGQFNAKIAKLKPNMTEIDVSTIVPDVLTQKEHYFHEGNFIVKRNGIYYMVYTTEKPRENGEKTAARIAYSTSDKPMGPYSYGGIIIDNLGCDPSTWNNHGSVVEFKGQWYIFYHRATQGSRKRRKACVEPITFNGDGSIAPVEMTSQGASGKPLDAFKTIEAERACRMGGHARIEPLSHDPNNLISPDNSDQIAQIRDGDWAEFKYVDFGKGAKGIEMRVAPATASYTIDIKLDDPDGERIGSVSVPGGGNGRIWKTVGGSVDVQGIHALYLVFSSKDGDTDSTLSVDWVVFK